MTVQQKIRSQALAMSPLDRAGLIEDLLASFDPVSRAEIDQAWAEEVDARIRAVDEGKMPTITLEECKRRIREK